MQPSFHLQAPTTRQDNASKSARQPARRMAADDNEHTGVAWLDASDPIETFMAIHSERIAPGWRKLAIRTLIKLLAVMAASPERRRAIAGIHVYSTDTELNFFTTNVDGRPDAVMLGIFRKARTRSCTVCRNCGRPARVRLIGEDESITQCTRCVAPRMLRHEIWELEQSLRFLKAVARPISASQIPALLRPSFLQAVAAESSEPDAEVKKGHMTLAQFIKWAEGWRQIGHGLAVVH